MSDHAAVVLGGYVNGWSIIRELHECGVRNIGLVDEGRSLARFSRKLKFHRCVEPTKEALRDALLALADEHGRLVLYPTNDVQLEHLLALHDDLEHHCFLPFNPGTLLASLDKNVQYATCARLGVPYPRTVQLEFVQDMARVLDLTLPIIVKPNKRDDLVTGVFRNLFIRDAKSLTEHTREIESALQSGVRLIASEFVPGDDGNVFAYTCYRSKTGEILGEWTGRKLSQFPNEFGIFASAICEDSATVLAQGRALVEGLDAYGVVEPEFKHDERDGRFKLMEVNLRPMMWHRTGFLGGSSLMLQQWNEATGDSLNTHRTPSIGRTHFVYMKHEISNLIGRPGYRKKFTNNVFGGEAREYAVLDRHDPMPFLYDLLFLPRAVLASWLRRSGMR